MSEPGWRAELSDGQLRGELDRVHPKRVRLRPWDLAGTRQAMDVVDEMWAPTLAWARRFPREKLHQRVDGEYSFVETQRHLLFAGDAWLQRMVLRVPDPFHEWGVPPDLPADAPPDTGPALEEVMPVREAREDAVRAHLATLSEDDLRGPCRWPLGSAGFPTRTPCTSHRLLPCCFPRGVVAPPVR